MGNTSRYGSPRIATYEKKGLDYFLQAPRLKAEAKASALNMIRSSDMGPMAGLIEEDVPKIQKMGSFVTDSRAKHLDHILEGGSLSSSFIHDVAKNYSNSKELEKKVAHATFNAQKRAQIEDQLNKASMANPKMRAYYDNIKNKTNEQFSSKGGTFSDKGEINQYNVLDNIPNYVDIIGNLRGRAATVMADMERISPGSSSGLNIRPQRIDLGGGNFANILTYTEPKTVDSNTQALKALVDDFNKSLLNADGSYNTSTDVGRFAEFQGDSYMQGILSQIPGQVSDFQRTKLGGGEEKIQNLGLTTPPVVKANTTPGVRLNGDYSIDPNFVAASTTNTKYKKVSDYAPVKGDNNRSSLDWKSYNQGVKDNYTNMLGATMNLSDLQTVFTTPLSTKENPNGSTVHQAYSNDYKFAEFIRGQAKSGSGFGDYDNFQSQMRRLSQLNEQGGDESMVMQPTERGTERGRLKNTINEYVTEMYGEYTSTLGERVGTHAIDFNYMRDGKPKDAYPEVVSRLASDPDVRVMQFTVGDNELIPNFTSSSSNESSALIMGEKSRLNKSIGTKGGYPSRPQLLTYSNMDVYLKPLFKGKDPEEVKEIKSKMNGSFVYKRLSDEADYTQADIPVGTELLTLYENQGLIQNPGNTPILIEGQTKPTSIIRALDNLEIQDQFTTTGADGVIRTVKRTTGNNYVVMSSDLPAGMDPPTFRNRQSLINQLYR